MSHDDMGSDDLMGLEARLRRAEDIGGNEPMGRVRYVVQSYVQSHPARAGSQLSRRLSMFAAIGIPVAAAAAIAAVVLLNTPPRRAIVPVPAATPTGSPTPLQTLSPSPSTNASPVAETCRLPLTNLSYNIVGPAAGFMTYPTGAITLDPASELTVDGAISHVKARPNLRGTSYAPSYDLAMHQWLPVPFDSISPDGRQYAWVDSSRVFPGNGGPIIQPLHVTDVATGRDRVVNSDRDWGQPVWDSADTIYIVRHATQSDASLGLWRISPSTGVATMINADGFGWRHIGHGSAWSERQNAADPHPPASKYPANTTVRLDLATGAITDWMYRPGQYVEVIGTTQSGDPLVAVSPTGDPGVGNELWLLSAPETGRKLAPAGGTLHFAAAWADGPVTWLQARDVSVGPQDALYRMGPTGAITRVTALGTAESAPTGGCH